MKPLFIVFESADGVGTTTQVSKLAKYLFEKKCHVVKTREPSYIFPQGLEIRRRLFSGELNKEDMLRLYTEDRKENTEKVIKPALSNNLSVICDRYKYSTIAYQTAQGIPLERTVESQKQFLSPDIVFIFRLHHDIAQQRMNTGREKDEFEKDVEFQKRLSEIFNKMPNLFPEENIVFIDASKTIDEVFEDIKKEVDKKMGES